MKQLDLDSFTSIEKKDLETNLSQKETIANLLVRYKLLPNTALNKVCYRYSARINELRKEGWVIQTLRDGKKPRIFYYRLIRGKRNE